jgi:hypothetical protein
MYCGSHFRLALIVSKLRRMGSNSEAFFLQHQRPLNPMVSALGYCESIFCTATHFAMQRRTESEHRELNVFG